MVLEGVLLGVALRADVALEGLLAAVCQQVALQVVVVGEVLEADAALEVFVRRKLRHRWVVLFLF